MNEKVNNSICPFCQEKNTCMAHADQPCWCNSITLPEELRAIIPEKARGKACICCKCIQLFKDNPDEFRQRMNISL